jgi:hypothetical protein
MSTTVAAAVRQGQLVFLARREGEQRFPMTVLRVHNSTPMPGRITWELANGETHEIGAAASVETIF